MVHSLAMLTAGFLMVMVFVEESCVNWRCLFSPPTRDKMKNMNLLLLPFQAIITRAVVNCVIYSLGFAFGFGFTTIIENCSVEIDTATTSSTSVEETSHLVSKHWAEEKFSSAPSCSVKFSRPA